MAWILLTLVSDEEFNSQQLVTDCALELGLFLFTGCMLVPLGSLVGFHVYLVVGNISTNEYMTQSYSGQNPFDLGVVKNCGQFLFAPQEASALAPGRKVPHAKAVSHAFRAKSSESPTADKV
jgi:hypothetical protein